MKKLILIITAFVLNIFIFNFANAENFFINNYTVKMNITEDRVAEIEEIIDVYFTENSHGIYRTIPIKNRIVREDGTSNTEYARITDFQSSQPYSIIPSNINFTARMGNADRYVSGDVRYSFKYKYHMGNDKVKDADEFYFNLIGTDWGTYINRVNFSITMPKDFDTTKLGFSTGEKGMSGYDPNFLKFNVQGNTINGYITAPLKKWEGITVRIELPDKYFIPAQTPIMYMGLLVIVLTIIPVILWMVYGKDDPVIPVVSFYPPKNRNSAEVEVEYSGDSTPKGVISLIFYLANKGYIEVDDDDINLTIKKVKPYDGNNKVEKAFMDGLFFGGKDVVTEIDLKISDVFTTYCSKISSALRRTLRVSLFNQDSCSFWKIALIILVIVGLFASMLYTLGDYSWALLTNEASMALLFPIIGTLVYAALLSTKNIATIAFGTIWAAGFIGMPMVMIVPMVQNFENNYPLFILEVLAIVVSVICLVNMPKRTEQGRRRLGEIMGFKKYLEVAEQKRIEDLIAENPNYCADVLPYAFILGVSDVWLKKISGLLNANPTWYKGTLNPERFNTFTSSLVSAATPVSSSGHSGGRSGRGHSGGGRSGGGHGGGGGGSW